jgi:hypothetical protein
MEEQSRMDNPKPLATFGTQDTGRRQTKHKKQQQTKKPDETSCSRKVSSSCLLFVLQVFLTSMYIDIVYLLICLFHVHRCCLFTDMSISGVNECSP